MSHTKSGSDFQLEVLRALPLKTSPFIGLLQLNADVLPLLLETDALPRGVLEWRHARHMPFLVFVLAPAASLLIRWLITHLLSFAELMKAMSLG